MKGCCENCRNAVGYWPMYGGDDPKMWATVRCLAEPSMSRKKRYRVSEPCGNGHFEPTAPKMERQEEVDKRIQDVVCAHLSIRPEQCTPEADLVADLGADDLDPIEIAMALEVEFGICFTDEEVDNSTTYGKLLALVKTKLSNK